MIYWSEHFFFDKKFSDYNELEHEKLYIQVFDHNLLRANSLIGELEIDLISLYFTEKHAILHQWAGLTNIKQNREEIKGYLKFSCSLIGPSDEPIQMRDEKYDDAKKTHEKQLFTEGAIGEININGVLFPPYIKIQGWQLIIRLIKGENLVKMDTIGSIDTFLVFEFGNAKYETIIIKDSPNPEWNMIINLPFTEPTINEILTLSVWDYDAGKPNELVSSVAFDIRSIKNKELNKFFWLNLYGAHPDRSKTKYGKLMDISENLASYWKGRILLSIESCMRDSPVLSEPKKIERIPTNELKQISMGNTRWQLIVDAFYGFSFPKSDKKYAIQIRWADCEIVFDKCKIEHGVHKWYSSKSILCDFPYKYEELPDVIIYLCQGNERICFLRLKSQNLEEKAKLYNLLPDKSVDLKKPIRKHKAGFVKMGFQISASQISGEKNLKPISKTLEENKLVPGTIISHIYMAQDLIPADSNGSSDPFYKISYYGQKIKGEIVKRSLNPVWYKTHVINAMLFPFEECPPIILHMYDADTVGKDFIGSCLLNVQQGVEKKWIAWKENYAPKPVWHDLEYESHTNCGKFLASFQFIEGNQIQSPYQSMDIRPPTEKYQVKLNILGMRELRSLGLFPVTRPFIKFDINGMKTNDRKESLYEKKSLQTLPSDSGANPNICTILTFDLELPIDITYCPSLNCTVFDWILKGLSEPSLGVFTINFPEYIMKTKQRVERKLEELNKKLSFPQQINLENTAIAMNPSKFFEISSHKPETLTESLLKNSKDPLKLPTKSLKPLDKSDIYLPDGTINSENIVKTAEYAIKKSQRIMEEVNTPCLDAYMPLGYDNQLARHLQKSTKKHYRHYLSHELEKSPFLDAHTFDEFPIKRGKRFENYRSSFEKTASIEVSSQKDVGKCKGWVSIMSETDRKRLDAKKQQSQSSNTLLKKLRANILEKTLCLIRVYVLKAENLPKMDLFSASDPYLKLILGADEQNNRKEHQTDKVNCDFFKLFTFKATLPGASQLKIQVWDYDFLVPDDLIGETTIDLENRYFSKKWRALQHVPIETRELVHPLHRYEKNGRLSLWLEIHALPLQREILWEITPKPAIEYEIRIVVWEVEGVPSMDVEDCSDLYIEANFRGKTQKTDIHYRAQNGFGSFNWRMLWDVMLSDEDMDLTIGFQVWDKDFLSPNDYIAEETLSFEEEAREAYKNDISMKKIAKKQSKITRKFKNFAKKLQEKEGLEEEEKFVLELKNTEKEDLKLKTKGKLTLSFEIIPKSIAKENPVGLGRNEPNHSPWLPPPVGRFEWTANPFKLFTRCVGPKARAKVCCCICISLCIVIVIAIAPIVLGNLASKILLILD